MRLLDTTTKKLVEFQGYIPPYAILSHIWETEEVAFRDIANLEGAAKMCGFAKIAGACETARRHGLKYIWIDTCCINKDSSSEISEAVNSMYMWYKNAHVCYAYLSDVLSEDDHKDPCSLFAMSHWFTRGWTLQELIAPSRVIFYARDWVDIGTKATLQRAISAVTGISTGVIVGQLVLDDVPVAVRMSWAADRNTTREEDIAYSLMGLFGINMPLLYGEGGKAFIRLQHKIIKKSNDHSIFAWTTDSDERRGILARSPSEFRGSGKVKRSPQVSLGGTEPNDHAENPPAPYSMTNQGLHIKLPVVVDSQDKEHKTIAFLNCHFSGKLEPITITLVRPRSVQSKRYIRTETMTLERTTTIAGPAQMSSIYIADDYYPPDDHYHPADDVLTLKVKVPAGYGNPHIQPIGCHARGTDEKGWWLFNTSAVTDEAVLVFGEPHGREQFAVIVGTQKTGAAWCRILKPTKSQDWSEWNALSDYRSFLTDRGIRWTRENQFLDRASVDLAYGWSVAVSLVSTLPSNLHSQFLLHAKIEIKESSGLGHRVSPPKQPKGGAACLVIPPAPEHGFVVDTHNLQQNWVEHLGSFIFYAPLHGSGVPGLLVFRNSNSKEVFFLLVEPSEGAVQSAIEERGPEDLERALITNESRFKNFYSVVLSRGKMVFVIVRARKDTSVANHVIILSMRGDI